MPDVDRLKRYRLPARQNSSLMLRGDVAEPTKCLFDVFVFASYPVKDRLVVCAQIAKRSHQQSDEQHKHYSSHSHTTSLRPAVDCSFLYGSHAGCARQAG